MPSKVLQSRNTDQVSKAELFRRLHNRTRTLLLPNAWDAMSARLFEHAGFEAIATTSGGVAWALGYRDGEDAPRDEIIAATARIARAVDVPVTADIEAGFGSTPEYVADTVKAIIAAGAVGINLEDGTHRAGDPIRNVDEAAARIHAARSAANEAGVPVVINARTDLYLLEIGDEQQRFDAAVQRARAYFANGADCFFPIGLGDPIKLAALVRALDMPVNVIVRPGSASIAELERTGVARLSTATSIACATMGFVENLAQQLHEAGMFSSPVRIFTHAEAQALFKVNTTARD